jgi:CMP-N-acetylneuraminic acid synthetase
MKKINNLIIIPCKKHSSRLPNKNLKIFNNSTNLLEITIKQAKSLSLKNKIVLSSDSNKILLIGEKNKILTIKRPKYLAKKNSTLSEVILNTISTLEKRNYTIDNIIVLQVTSPLRKKNQIQSAFRYFKKINANSVISVCETFSPIQWANTLGKNLSIKNFMNNKYIGKMSQDLKKNYQINGAIYIAKANIIKKYKRFYNIKKSYAYIMPRSCSIDIDTMLDFKIAESIAKIKNYQLL